MANEEKKTDTSQVQMSCGARIAVNVITLIVVIIACFAAGFATATLIQEKNDDDRRPNFNQMPQMNQQNPGGSRRFTPNSNNDNDNNNNQTPSQTPSS